MRNAVSNLLIFIATANMKDTENMAEHKHGDMNIEVQEKTFDGFVKIVAWSCVWIAVFLVFLALVNG